MPGSPLASERQWRDVLAACGFTDISTAAPTTEAGAAFQSVVAAVSDGVVAGAGVGAGTGPVRPQAPLPAQPSAPTPVSRDDDTLQQVTEVFARVLEMAPGQLDPDLTFENYGVDSLVVLELTRALETAYGPQSATLLFERITIRQLAEHFRATAQAPASVPISTPVPAPTPVSTPTTEPAGPPRPGRRR